MQYAYPRGVCGRPSLEKAFYGIAAVKLYGIQVCINPGISIRNVLCAADAWCGGQQKKHKDEAFTQEAADGYTHVSSCAKTVPWLQGF
jgi:hypothetical protein